MKIKKMPGNRSCKCWYHNWQACIHKNKNKDLFRFILRVRNYCDISNKEDAFNKRYVQTVNGVYLKPSHIFIVIGIFPYLIQVLKRKGTGVRIRASPH